MSEDKIPTAEELFEKKFNDTECFLDYDKRGLKLINDVILEHTKLHVEAALNDVAKYVKEFEGSNVYDYLIKNSYPNTKIK
jgi:hypothetical protein